MPRVSKIKVDKDLERAITRQFWSFLGNINGTLVASDFFSDFLTESEEIMLSKRFATLVLLSRGKSPTEIQKSIHVTFSTIGSVHSWFKNAKPETKKLLVKISTEKDWEAVFSKIEEILDKIPPRRGSDWKSEYQNRRKALNQKLIEKSLR